MEELIKELREYAKHAQWQAPGKAADALEAQQARIAELKSHRLAGLIGESVWNDGLAGYPREARQHVRKAYKMNQDCQVSREMPRYKCHKEVWALKIAEITFHEKDNGAHISPAEEGYGPFEVDEQFLVKHKPEVGGYYVVYADGYKSFSPAKAFEDGYSLV